MILHALHKLYDRLEGEKGEYLMPSFGYSLQRIAYAIVIDPISGEFSHIAPLRTTETDKRGKEVILDRPMLVPGGDKPTGGVTAKSVHKKTLFLRNDCRFLLCADPKKAKEGVTLGPSPMTFDAFREAHLAVEKEIGSNAFSAVCRFLVSWSAQRLGEILDPSVIATKEGKAAVGVFSFRNQQTFAHEDQRIRDWWEESTRNAALIDTTRGKCIVTFPESHQKSDIARLHTPKIKGVNGAQPSGALLISFDKDTDAYTSFGGDKLQAYNAPVSIDAAFKYCAALSTLTSSPSPAAQKHRFHIGDATTVFWTETPTNTESVLNAFLGGDFPNSDEEDEDEIPTGSSQATNLVASLYNSLRSLKHGGKPESVFEAESKTHFYILGLTGQAGGRIGIRFWHRTHVGDLLEKLAKHHANLAIVPEWDENSKNPDPEFPPLWMLLRQTGRESKDIPPNLGGALMRAILNGTPYPTMLPERVLSRIRVSEKDQNDKPKDRVNYLRAAILKAFLNRNHKLEMDEALDKNRPEAAYHLGRLFAVYETAQKHAHDWKLERTIRETMFSAASATPLAVFGRLERLHHHHTAKKSHPPGSSDSYAEIVSEIEQHFRGTPLYPASLNLVGQSLFSVGYYHQLHDFRTLSDLAKAKRETAPAGD